MSETGVVALLDRPIEKAKTSALPKIPDGPIQTPEGPVTFVSMGWVIKNALTDELVVKSLPNPNLVQDTITRVEQRETWGFKHIGKEQTDKPPAFDSEQTQLIINALKLRVQRLQEKLKTGDINEESRDAYDYVNTINLLEIIEGKSEWETQELIQTPPQATEPTSSPSKPVQENTESRESLRTKTAAAKFKALTGKEPTNEQLKQISELAHLENSTYSIEEIAAEVIMNSPTEKLPKIVDPLYEDLRAGKHRQSGRHRARKPVNSNS